MPRIASNDGQRMTTDTFKEALRKGLYMNSGGARRALAKSKLSKADKAKLHMFISKNTQWSGVRKDNKKPSRTARQKAALQKHTKKTPFCILFHQEAINGKSKLLEFLRAAAHEGMTLPDIIHAFESV